MIVISPIAFGRVLYVLANLYEKKITLSMFVLVTHLRLSFRLLIAVINLNENRKAFCP